MNWPAVLTYALVSFASFVAGAWFALVLLRRATATRRAGYVKLPASAGTNQTTVRRVPTSTSLSRVHGTVSAEQAGLEALAEWSRRVGPSFSGRAPAVPGAETGRTPPESAAHLDQIDRALRRTAQLGAAIEAELERRKCPICGRIDHHPECPRDAA